MTGSGSRRVIVVAGMPRSGSTWLFNAARLLLEASGEDIHAAWVGDRDADHPAPVHLIKAHAPREVTFPADLVLTTHRPFVDCLASLIRMGWLEAEPEAIRKRHAVQKATYDYWAARSALELPYDQITGAPATAIARLAGAMGLEANPARDRALAEALAALSAPDGTGYDPHTLLHPGHRAAEAAQTNQHIALVRAALA